MPLTEPAVRFSRNGLFTNIHINSYKAYTDYGVSSGSEADTFLNNPGSSSNKNFSSDSGDSAISALTSLSNDRIAQSLENYHSLHNIESVLLTQVHHKIERTYSNLLKLSPFLAENSSYGSLQIFIFRFLGKSAILKQLFSIFHS